MDEKELQKALAAVAKFAASQEGELDRLEVRRATPGEYAVRVYLRGVEEFEGTVLTVPV